MPEVQRYRDATEAVLQAMSFHPSIVSTSILSAIAAAWRYQATQRQQQQALHQPLMSLYWCFHLDSVPEDFSTSMTYFKRKHLAT